MSTINPAQTHQKKGLRATEQYLAPHTKEKREQSGYDIYPCFGAAGPIHAGLDSLIAWMLGRRANIIIDGYVGVQWEAFAGQLRERLAAKQIPARFININTALKPDTAREALTAPYLGGNDPSSGKYSTASWQTSSPRKPSIPSSRKKTG